MYYHLSTYLLDPWWGARMKWQHEEVCSLPGASLHKYTVCRQLAPGTRASIHRSLMNNETRSRQSRIGGNLIRAQTSPRVVKLLYLFCVLLLTMITATMASTQLHDRESSGQIFIFWWCDVHILCFVFPLLTNHPLTEHQPQTSGQEEAGAELARKCQNRKYGQHNIKSWLLFW